MAANQHIARRAVLKGAVLAAPVSLAAALTAGDVEAAVAAVMEPETETPVMALFRECERISAAAAAHVSLLSGKDEDEEMERLFWRERDVLEERMMALPCQTPADFAAKVIIDTCRGGLFSNWETGRLWVEARALTGVAA